MSRQALLGGGDGHHGMVDVHPVFTYLLRAGRLSIASFECAQSSAIKARMTEPNVARANKYGQGGERREVPRKVTE